MLIQKEALFSGGLAKEGRMLLASLHAVVLLLQMAHKLDVHSIDETNKQQTEDILQQLDFILRPVVDSRLHKM
jgi:hypothetical protein